MNVAKLRKKLNMSQHAFAQYIGVHPMTVSRWERGETEPSKPILLLLALIDFDLCGFWDTLEDARANAWGKR